MLRNNNPLTPDIRALNIRDSDTQRALETISETLDRVSRNVYALQVVQTNTPASPVGNLLWNGELGHSVNSWHDIAYVVNDTAREAAWWFSHNKPAASRTFSAIATNNTIPVTAHEFSTAQTVDLTTTGTLPSGGANPPAIATTYFVVVVDPNNVSLASTVIGALAGTADVTFNSGTGSGSHTIQEKLIDADARTALINNELKTTAHSNYHAQYSRWNSSDGWGELTGTKSIDQILPGNLVDATTPLARVSLIATKKNQYIEIPDDCLMGAGIWDNTSEQRKFLEGDIGFTASVVGTPATTVERRYRVLFTSDRGYSLLSPEIMLAAAPRDSSFSSTAYIQMGWRQQAGQLQVDIYEYLPVGPESGGAAVYRLVNQVSSATSYIHQGGYIAAASGYPTPTGDTRTATYFTRSGDLALLNYYAAGWDTINFPIGIPNNYDKGNTTNRQWLRVWLTVAPNLFIEGCTTDGSTTITAPAAVFDAEYDALFDAGTLVLEVYDENDVLLHTTTVASRTDDTHIVAGVAVAAGSNRKIRIVGGGFHGVYLDKIHLGYQQNTSYSPNPLDVRTLQPLAAPASGTNPDVGGGGTGGGINTCVVSWTPVKQHDRTWQSIDEAESGDLWAAAAVQPNMLLKTRPGIARVRRVRSANGVEIYCTDSEKFVVDESDIHGTPLYQLRVGDRVLTEIDDRLEQSTIVEITEYLGVEVVYTPSLSTTHYWIAGRLSERSPSLWKLFKNWLFRRSAAKYGGFVLHNLKPIETQL